MSTSRRLTPLAVALLLTASTVSCSEGVPAHDGTGDGTATEEIAVRASSDPPSIVATNAFYYYDDLDTAWAFYTDVLGLPTVSDFGFAKILRVAERSYLTLVAADEGMHSSSEPKSVTLALITDEVEGWYAHLSEAGVPMRADLEPGEDRPHDGFVAIDPEGYFLEFERFNVHPENENLLPALEGVTPQGSPARPDNLRIRATVLWLYFDDMPRIERFYREILGADVIVDQGWAKVIQASTTGFIGLVDGTRGLHEATEQKAVTVSFFTDDLEGWFERTPKIDGFELRTSEITDESDRVRVFVGYDPEGYFLEWDDFLDLPGNEELVKLLDVDLTAER